MPEIIRTKERVYRDDYSSDDERSSSYRRPSGGYTTVQRYRVAPNRQLRVVDDDDDLRSMRSERLEVGTRHHRLEVDRRVERAEQIERPRSALEYREPGREREVKRTVVYERERPREPLSPRGWERERDVPFERERETDVRIERRRERDEEPVEYERVSRETEYYGRPDPPQPIVIREPPVEKYEVVRREKFVDNREVAPSRRQEEDYYRRDVREVEPRREEVALARYDRREVRSRGSVSDDDESVVYERKDRRVVRDRSHSPRHKLHIAEGALAGAGAAALIANHREKGGGVSEHRGRKVAGGALAGALGAELITRARSHYRDKSRDRSRSRSRSSSRGGGKHTKLKTGLALAATAIAAAAAGKYIANRNERKEEAGRGRSRTRSPSRHRRYSSDDGAGEGAIKHDAKHRAATIAKAGAGAAVVGAIAEHIRNKSQGRSKSRLRTGGVAAATGLAGAAIAGIYEARKAKQDAADAEAGRGRKHTSRSRSRPRSLVYDDPDVDPELGMVEYEYGTHPVYAQPGGYYDPAATAAERSRERRSSSSRSRLRDIASGAVATGAAAIGITQYQKRRERKEAERERREAERERRRYEEEAPPPEEHYYAQGYDDDRYTPSPPHASGGVHYNEPPLQGPPAGYTQTTHTTHVDGYPPHPAYDPAHQPPFDPAAFPAGPPPPVDPYGYPPREAAREGGNVSSITPFAPQAQPPPPRALYNMSDEEARIITPSTSSGSRTVSPTHEQSHNKSVAFAPLSPTSTRTLAISRTRRNSDPSSDRPNIPSRHRRRHRNPSRSPSPIPSDEVEVLPDRFDKDGRPLDANGHVKPKETEMVERIVHDFGDVIEGRQSWRSLLRGFFEEAGDGGSRRR